MSCCKRSSAACHHSTSRFWRHSMVIVPLSSCSFRCGHDAGRASDRGLGSRSGRVARHCTVVAESRRQPTSGPTQPPLRGWPSLDERRAEALGRFFDAFYLTTEVAGLQGPFESLWELTGTDVLRYGGPPFRHGSCWIDPLPQRQSNASESNQCWDLAEWSGWVIGFSKSSMPPRRAAKPSCDVGVALCFYRKSIDMLHTAYGFSEMRSRQPSTKDAAIIDGFCTTLAQTLSERPGAPVAGGRPRGRPSAPLDQHDL